MYNQYTDFLVKTGDNVDKHRQVAFIMAFIVAMVIMMIGKACTDSSMKKKQVKPVQFSGTSSQVVPENNNNYNNVPQQNNQIQTEAVQEQTTEPSVEYVTNLLGEIVGTAEPTTTAVQPATDENGEYSEETQVQTTTEWKSILDEYNEEKQNNQIQKEIQNGNSGDSVKQNEDYQIPSEIKITIN